MPSLGLIAGNRSLPLVFARQARGMGVSPLVAVAFEGETDPALAQLVDEMIWIKVGQLNKLIRAFSSRNIGQCVMLGQIAPKNLFDLRPDLRIVGMLLRLKERNAHTLFTALADELKRDGIELIDPTPWLQALMPQDGFALGPKPSAGQLADAEYGFRIAKEISKLDIGQTVVVKSGAVLAVEGFEGTDACLRRGGELAGDKGGVIAVKVAKPKHDTRFDLPCLGLQTLETCTAAGVSLLAFEANRTLLLDRPEIDEYARKHRLSVLAFVGAKGG